MLAAVARMGVLHIFHFHSRYTLCPFPTLLCALEERTCIDYIFLLPYAKNQQSLEAWRRAWCWCLFPLLHIPVTSPWLDCILNQSCSAFRWLHTALSPGSRNWSLTWTLHLRKGNDVVPGFPILCLHVWLFLDYPTCVYHLFLSRIPSDDEVWIFVLSGGLFKAVVFGDSADGLWPKKSNHMSSTIPEFYSSGKSHLEFRLKLLITQSNIS